MGAIQNSLLIRFILIMLLMNFINGSQLNYKSEDGSSTSGNKPPPPEGEAEKDLGEDDENGADNKWNYLDPNEDEEVGDEGEFTHADMDDMEDEFAIFDDEEDDFSDDPSYSSSDEQFSWDQIVDPRDSLLVRKSQILSMQLLARRFKIESLDDDFVTKVIPLCLIANDHLETLVKIDAEIGINQDFRDTIVKMMKQAKFNIAEIEELKESYDEVARVERKVRLKPITELEKEYTEIKKIYAMKLGFYEYGDVEKFLVRDILKSANSELKSIRVKEEKTLRTIKLILNEQKSLISLGYNLWVNSQEDYSNKRQIDEEEEQRLRHERRNAMQRNLVSSYRQLTKNDTEDDADPSIPSSKSDKWKKDEL